MRLFVIADLHLSEGDKVDKPMSRFGQRWENHVQRLREAWEAQVSREDTVLIPGDISWAMHLRDAEADLRLIDSLPGEKILMRGNHDYWWGTLSRLRRFAEEKGLSSLRFLQNTAEAVGENMVVAGTRLWLWPDDSRFAKADNKILDHEKERLERSLEAALPWQKEGRELLLITHYPPFGKNLGASDFTALIRDSGAKQAFFGHIHQSDSPYNFRRKEIDGVSYSLVSADCLNFQPLEVRPLMEK